MRLLLIALLSLTVFTSKATIIDPTNRIDWVPGVNVGVRGGIPAVTTVYTNFYTTNTAAEIQSGINNCPSNQVVMLPSTTGVYDIHTGLTLDRPGVVLRGAGSNTTLYGHITVGHSFTTGTAANPIAVTYGGGKGSTNCGVAYTTNAFVESITVGDSFAISAWFNDTNGTIFPTANNTNFPVISVANYKNTLRQVILCTGITGTNITFWPPLTFNFTNTAILTPLNEFGISSLMMRPMIGLESFTLVSTNSGNNDVQTFMINASMVRDSWMTNLNVLYPNNYCINIEECTEIQVDGCSLQYALSAGTSHSGFIGANVSGLLFQNNIVGNITQLGFMFNDGFCGNAVFGNFFTNNTQNGDILCHNTHPAMNLFEANVWPVKFIMDGYFGSASHQTVFRNYHPGSMAMKRWVTFMQVVGNVVGTAGQTPLYLQTTNGFSVYPVFDIGFPNIGNNTYIALSPPNPFNYPGDTFPDFQSRTITNNGIFALTNDQPNTATLVGYFANLEGDNTQLSNFPYVFQDPNNTNKYWFQDGTTVAATANGTTTNITFNKTASYTNGWRVYEAGQIAYQWFHTNQYLTENLHGNLVYTNAGGTVVWDSNNADHNLPASLLYTNGAPSWWGTNRWPAIDPTNAAPVAKIPAQVRYDTGFSPGGAVVTSTTFGSGSTISTGTGSKLYFGQ